MERTLWLRQMEKKIVDPDRGGKTWAREGENLGEEKPAKMPPIEGNKQTSDDVVMKKEVLTTEVGDRSTKKGS